MLSQNRKSAQSRQSNYSIDINNGLEEKKETGTPQPHRRQRDSHYVDVIADLPGFERSARLLLVINEEPRLSLISEGVNSLQTVTVDDYLMTTHQGSVNVPSSNVPLSILNSSEDPHTIR